MPYFQPKNNRLNITNWLVPFSLATLLIVISNYNFLLFHTLAELFAIVVAILIFVVGWQTYPYTRNHFLMYLGCGYFWIASLDLIHTMTYEGLAIFETTGANIAVQFWIGTRYIEAILLLSAPWFLKHELNRTAAFFGFALLSLVLYLAIKFGYFPAGFIEGQGLTRFKIISEYIIVTMLALAVLAYIRQNELPEKSTSRNIILAIVLTISAELAFTFYISIYDLSNIIGHIFKFFSFWLIFMAIVRNTLQEPFDTLYRSASTYDALPDATIAVDRNGTILQANTSACRLAGLTRTELTGQQHHEIYHPASFDIENCPICRHCRDNIALDNLELEYDNEKATFFAYSLSELKGSGVGNIIVEVIRDISVKKRTESSLQRAQKMDAIGKLTGGIAHDFNNMLGVILGFAEILKSRLSRDEQKLNKYTDEIINAGERARKLTSKLLEFSRKAPSSDEEVSLNLLLSDIQHMLEKTLTPRIKLDYQLAEHLWPVWLDKTRLEDAILNISINAMHAMPNGGKLTISTRNTQLDDKDASQLEIPAGDYIALSIEDTGTGMDNETLQKIFDPFFSTKGEQGTGLGLSQVYGFTQQSNGGIQVDSEIGKGTRFTLYFPRPLQSSKADPGLGNSHPEATAAGTETILVVDDERALLELAREILTANGYEVLCAESAEQAMTTAKLHHFDLLLSDVVLPGTGGYELAANMQTLYPDIKVQMVSGYSDKSEADSANPTWHQQCLQKPFTTEALLKQVRDRLDETAPGSQTV